MPHRIDIDAIHEDAFLLLNLCYAASEFSRKHKLDPMDDSSGIGHAYYFAWLKFVLSEKLIASAVRVRIVLDFLRDEDPQIDLVAEDRRICERHHLGELEGDSVALSVREACNKIIHADDVSPDTETFDGECERWNGWLYLHGVKGGAEWQLHLELAAFCQALDELLVFLEERYDWYHVYKYD